MKGPAKRLGIGLSVVLLALANRFTAQASAQDTAITAAQSSSNESVQAAEAQRAVSQQMTPQQRAVAQARPVARLSHLAGTVQIQTNGMSESAVQAALNMPLLQGERIVAADHGEAEIEFPDGSVLRMTPNSAATLEQLVPDNGATQIELGDGLFYLELRASERGSDAVAVGETTLLPQQNSSFRVRVTGGQVEAAVLNGLVSVTRANAYTADLQAGESLRSDPRNSKRYLLADSVPPESWDNWNESLAQAALDQQNARTSVRDNYAGDQGYGWSDLDANGNWYNVPGEGQVWQPSGVAANFDPYGNGSWVDGGAGYVWASSYGWGWLPYRCGTWDYYGGFGWGWIPTAGCRNFAGWYGGGYGDGYGYGYNGGVWNFPVRHPPLGWQGPKYPLDQTSSGLRIHRLATVPVESKTGTKPVEARAGSGGQPVRIGSVMVSPLRPVANRYTSRGQSAVGSTFARDFPVQTGTHAPLLGRVTTAPAAMPGRPAEWHAGALPATSPNGSGLTLGGALGAAGVRGDGRRGQRPVDVYVNTTGSVPYNATGPAPVNATGAPPVNATGSVPLGATGSVPVRATGVPPVNATGATPLPTRTGAGYGAGYGSGYGPRGGSGIGPVGGPPRTYQPLSPVPMINRQIAPAPGVAPRPMQPAPAPMAPRVSPAPAAAPAAPRVSAPAPSPSAPAAARPR